MLLMDKFLSQFFQAAVQFKYVIYLAGQSFQLVEHVPFLVTGQAATPRQYCRQHEQRNQLCGKGLGRGDTDLYPGPGKKNHVRLTGQ